MYSDLYTMEHTEKGWLVISYNKCNNYNCSHWWLKSPLSCLFNNNNNNYNNNYKLLFPYFLLGGGIVMTVILLKFRKKQHDTLIMKKMTEICDSNIQNLKRSRSVPFFYISEPKTKKLKLDKDTNQYIFIERDDELCL
jgi:hypothetical protein